MEKERVSLLENTLKQVIDWLKFAEAKNGSLAVVCCAAIFGFFRVYSSLNDVNFYLTVYAVSFFILVSAAFIIALISFVPRITPPFWIQMAEKSDSDNPLFFGHACKYSKGAYLILFNKIIEPSTKDFLNLETALCDQIVNNSRIAFIKYSVFGSALFLFLAGVLTPVGAGLLYWVKK
jgi:uncharacterized membrane protein